MSGGRPHARTLLRISGLGAVRALFERDAGRVERLFFEPRLAAAASPFCRLLAQARKPYREAPPEELARIAATPLNGGIVAVARPRPLLRFDPDAAAGWARDGNMLVILDGVSNPHNLGAIARSAAFFGIERMLLADRPQQALPSDAAYRIAEGGLEHLALYRARLPADLAALTPHYRLLGAAAEGGAPPQRGDRPSALILGNEETGAEPWSLARCEALVTIRGSGRVQSLNVASAAAILFYALAGGRAAASRRSSPASSAATASGRSPSARSDNAAASKVDRASRRGSRRSRA
jgi:RNA methyltransferase, TrmH family